MWVGFNFRDCVRLGNGGLLETTGTVDIGFDISAEYAEACRVRG